MVSGAPRPDVSVYQGGKLVKIIAMKFPTRSGGVDGRTVMQDRGDYGKIARSNGLDPIIDVVEMDVGEDCMVP